jgi:5'-nucleotidase
MFKDLKRRDFLKGAIAATVAGYLSQQPILAASETTIITILHTNDTHSQLEPFMPGTRNAGLGGAARRAAYVKRVRKENPNTLLCDGGDWFQGTPYFNFYRGEVEVKAMSAIGYDVVTMGNHDFDEGVDNLARVLKFAKFQVVSCNYDVSNSPLKEFVKPYVVRTLAGLRVGLFGMGVDFTGLVVNDKHKGVTWRNPLEVVPGVVEKLRKEEHCDLVIGMSHLGYRYEAEPERVSDLRVAQANPEIDFIVGGHTHSFMKEPHVVKHANGRETLLFQVGFGGVNVGRVDFTFQGRKLTSWRSSIHLEDGEQLGCWQGRSNQLG